MAKLAEPQFAQWLKTWVPQWVLLATMFSAPGFAKTPEAYQYVDQGIEKYQTGDFIAAEQAFAAAANVVPEDSRPIFDQACALAAQGKMDEAEALYERAKLARDPQLRAASLYNLGCLSADRAKAKFGDRPEEATPDARTEGLKLIEQAVARYRDCLSIDPDHADARHNLELLRLWVKHMQAAWKQRDRDKRRQEMGLLEFLEMIQSEQKELRRQSRELTTVEDSPRRRQSSSQLGHLQRELSEEIEPLQQKIRDSAQPSAPTGQAPKQAAQLSPEAEAALGAIIKVTEQAKSAMARASVDLIANNLADVDGSQRQSLDELQRVYQAVAPLEHLLQKAIQLEKGLIETTQATEDSAFEENEKKWVLADLPYEQLQLADSIAVIPPKADQAMRQLKAQPAVAGPAPPPGSNNGSDPKADRDAMFAAYEKAIELAPQAQTTAVEAAKHLEQQSWPEAKVKEEATLKILEEIAAQFPKQPQDPQQKPKDDSTQQDNQDSQKKDQDKDNQEKKDQDKEGNKKEQEKEKDGEKKKDGQKKDSSQPDQQQNKSAKEQQDLSKQRAESLLRQVRERERDYRELQKKKQAIIGGVQVEKDW